MIYDVTHLTRYSYGGSVAVNACALRLWPRQEEGQSVLAARIEVTPVPQMRSERTDVFDNRVTRIRIDAPHRELVIKARPRIFSARACGKVVCRKYLTAIALGQRRQLLLEREKCPGPRSRRRIRLRAPR